MARPRDIVLFYGGDAAAVQGELGDPSWRIEAVHLKQLSLWHQVKLLPVKKYLCVHIMRTRILADGQRQKKHTKIGRKHRTPSEKEKQGTPKVCFSPLRSKKSQPNADAYNFRFFFFFFSC